MSLIRSNIPNKLRLLNFDDLWLLSMMLDSSVRKSDIADTLNIDESSVTKRMRKIGFICGDQIYQLRVRRHVLSDGLGTDIAKICHTFIEDLMRILDGRSNNKTAE